MSTKKIVITFIIFINVLTATAQNWFTSDAEWRYFYWNFDTRVGYVQINVEGDEMVGGIMCKKLHAVRYLENISTFPPTVWAEDLGFEYVYEANNGDQVFIYANNQFYKLYDFNANIGDSWLVPNTHNDITCTPNTGLVTITNKGVETVSGQSLKFIELSTATPGSGARIYGKIYQYIGAIDTYFFPDIFPDSLECLVPSDALMALELLCYTDSTIGYGTCPDTILLNTEVFDLFTAPIVYVEDKKIVINTKEQLNLEVKMYNLVGQLITQKEEYTSSLILYKNNLSEGLYILNITIDNKVFVKKIKI